VNVGAAAEPTISGAEWFAGMCEHMRELKPGAVIAAHGPFAVVTGSAQWHEDHDHDRGMVPLELLCNKKPVIGYADGFVFPYARFYSKGQNGFGVDIQVPRTADAVVVLGPYQAVDTSVSLVRSAPQSDTLKIFVALKKVFERWLPTLQQTAHASAEIVLAAQTKNLDKFAAALVGETVFGIVIGDAWVPSPDKDAILACGFADTEPAKLTIRLSGAEADVDVVVGARTVTHKLEIGRRGTSAFKNAMVSAAAEPSLRGVESQAIELLGRIQTPLRTKHFHVKLTDAAHDVGYPYAIFSVYADHAAKTVLAVARQVLVGSVKVEKVADGLKPLFLTVECKQLHNFETDVTFKSDSSAAVVAKSVIAALLKKLQDLDGVIDNHAAAHVFDDFKIPAPYKHTEYHKVRPAYQLNDTLRYGTIKNGQVQLALLVEPDWPKFTANEDTNQPVKPGPDTPGALCLVLVTLEHVGDKYKVECVARSLPHTEDYRDLGPKHQLITPALLDSVNKTWLEEHIGQAVFLLMKDLDKRTRM